MTITEKLDLAIKQKQTGTTDGAFVLSYKGKILEKNTYMTNDEWRAFYAAMPTTACEEYSAGGGDELSVKNGRPPKMASYGSSSRLIYLLSREKKDFHFEKKLPTTVGGTANLDGFFEDENRLVFVEAKCHEPYAEKTNRVSTSYAALYEFINAHTADNLRIEMNPSKCGRYTVADYFVGDERLAHFDMKQMICHLLGIATGVLKGTLPQKQLDFIYLLYDPTDLAIEPDAKGKIDAIYARTCFECNLIDFADLLRVIFAFLRENRYPQAITDAQLDELLCKFTFTLASQDFYPLLLH